MPMEQLPGSHLLAALHSQMERMKTVVRVSKAATKKPHSRSNTDINNVYTETQNVALFVKDGPAVHRDLCHVLQALSLSQMQSFRLPGEYKSGIMAYVMQGRLQLRTRSKAAFKHGLDSLSSSNNDSNSSSGCPASSSTGGSITAPESSTSSSPASHKNSAGNSPSGNGGSNADGVLAGSSDGSKNQGKSGTASAPSEADLKALFDSIDKDGSGAIDVEELQYALSVMGIEKSPAEVQELMDSVDKDGSGQLEFEEFVLILTTKLGLGGGVTETAWQELPDGTWCLEVQQGGCFGEAALLQGLVQEGMVLALEDCSLLILEASSYHPILTHGFDGQLNEKVAILKRCSALANCISNRSDLRGLAYAAVSERYGWGGQLYAAGEAAGAMYIIQEGCCRIIAKQKVQSSNPAAIKAGQPSAQPAAATGSRNSSDTGQPSGDDAPAAVAVGRPAAAAAALLGSPRYGLHSPRSRMVERRTELAELGPGDIAGEASLLGLLCHQSAAVVSSASLLVLALQKQDLKQLLHPADMQQLMELLQLREDERQQRLTTASATSTAVQLQQQHIKAAGATAEPAPDLPSAWDTSTESLTNKAQGRLSMCGDSICAAGKHSSGGNSSSRAASCKSPRSFEKQQTSLQLPSTAAGVAAAIAAAGGSPRRDLPSRLEREKVNSVYQLLEDMSASTQEMEHAQSTAVSYAAAALAAAQAEAAAAAVSSAGGSCSNCSMTASGYGVAALYASSSNAGVRSSMAAGEAGNAPRSSSKLATVAANGCGAGSSTERSKGGDGSSPNTAKQNGSPDQRVTAAELLLPPGLQRKIEAALEKASGDGKPRPNGSSCGRSYRHNRTHERPATSIRGIKLTVGTVSNDGSISSRSQRDDVCMCGCCSSSGGCSASCPRACRNSSNSSRVGRNLCLSTAQYASCPGVIPEGQKRLVQSTSAGHAAAGQSPSNTGKGVAGAATASGCDVGDGGHFHQPQQQSANSSRHTTDGSGAVMQQQVKHCCSICGSQNGRRLSSTTSQFAANPRCRQPQGHISSSGNICSPAAAVVAAAVAGLTSTSSPRSSKPLSAGFNVNKPTSPRSPGALLQPLGTCTAPDTAISNQLVQGFIAPVVTNHSSGGGQAAPCPGRNSNPSCLEICTDPTCAWHNSMQPPGYPHVQLCLQDSAHAPVAPVADGFFLPESGRDGWRVPTPVISEEAATAISAAVAAAETMRATNSIDLGLSRMNPPCTSRTPRTFKVSAAAIAMQQTANSTAATSAAGTAADAAASARRCSSTAAAMLQSVAGSMFTSAAGRQPGTLMLQTMTTSACGATTTSSACTGLSCTSSNSSTACKHSSAAIPAAQEMQQHTPRSSKSPRVSAKPIPVWLFSAVDRPVWQAAEAAAGCTSWSLGVRLLQSPRAASGNDVHNSCMPGCPGADIGCRPDLGDLSAGTASPPSNQQGQQHLNAEVQPQQQQPSQPTHGYVPCVPRLPLQKLQGMMLSNDAQDAAVAWSNIQDCNTHCCDNPAVLQVSAASATAMKATFSTATNADETACRSLVAALDAVGNGMLPVKSNSLVSRSPGSQPAQTAIDARAVTAGRRLQMPGSWHQEQQKQQKQQQRHHQRQKLSSAPLQQLKLPYGSAASTAARGASEPMPVAPLPEWRSALTTRWRQGGRFSQQGGPQNDKLHVYGSQTSRL